MLVTAIEPAVTQRLQNEPNVDPRKITATSASAAVTMPGMTMSR